MVKPSFVELAMKVQGFVWAECYYNCKKGQYEKG